MLKRIRNFSIIAHVDHGKSTLSDRIIQICGGLNKKEMIPQVLDSMELERERGITIKSQNVTLNYRYQKDNQWYRLNLIDTPGHIDFYYEVCRALSACEGALLVIDSTQGVEAQTIANYRIAMEMNLKIIVVFNKIDLITSDVSRVSKEVENIFGIDSSCIIQCSAKTGFGVSELLEHVILDIAYPKGSLDAPLQALIIDSWFNNYLGVVSLVCIKNGKLHKGSLLISMSTGHKYVVDKVGIFTPKQVHSELLSCGEVGWVVYASKSIMGAAVGDTLTLFNEPADVAYPGFKKVQHYVYVGLFPAKFQDQRALRDALYKLSFNDASLSYDPENSEFLGSGFRCGFLGLLHMEIVQERLKREYSLNLIITTPMVIYEVLTIDNVILLVDNPSKLLSCINKIKEIREPIVLCNILLPSQHVGDVIALCVEKRGVQISMTYHGNQVHLIYELPMSEIILDFSSNIKSLSHGYASFEYGFHNFQSSNIVCVEILINGKRIDALSIIVHYKQAVFRGNMLVNRLQCLIPRQQFDVIIQAVIGKRVICKSVVKQLRKNVLSKCHGGDITRKKKLLSKQKVGKRRMKQMGNIILPHEIFLSMLDINNKKDN